MTESSGKDTVYVDVDDDITAVIEKVTKSESKIVAMVLPKKATSLHSLVNIRLLKKSAKDAGKNVVLITTEKAVLPLAGAAGVYVASNASSKPKIPPTPEVKKEEVDDSVQVDDVDKTKTIEEAEKAADSKKPKSGNSPKIPNFERFRKQIIIGVGVFVVLLIGWWFAVSRAPSANITITTNASTTSSSFVFTADPDATEVNVKDGILPAKTISVDKTEKQTAPATGEKDLGTKASGSVTVSNCADDPAVISIGSKLTAEGKSYESDTALSLDSGNFDSGGDCKTSGSHVGTIQVTADQQGEDYNLDAGKTFALDGFSSLTSGTGGAITGGSSKIAKVVSNQDIDNAKGKLTISDDNVLDELKQQLDSEGYFAIPESLIKEKESEKASPKVDQEADEVEVTYKATFKLTGIRREDIAKIIENNLVDEIENDKQEILDDGLDTASFTILESEKGTVKVNVSTLVKIGAFIDEKQIVMEIAGKKSGESENIIKDRPGVVDVRVSYSPFWVNKTPKDPERINIEMVQQQEE